ncbi:hypothetical protein J2S43_005513 [Catenuloplanes nepalensis]|uniref:Lipoprotein n=1 Tax=Catenuloplanes nepalensis TaxID=587533 RepID=A0ABT9N148_9ACTN|nr:hypothetical protein [Catenuloplanes nepalensis]MDP9797001.1 hypothetical protein [Catenuloplanes nepalensis]
MKALKSVVVAMSAVAVLGVTAGCGGSESGGGAGAPAAGGTEAAAPAVTPADPKEAFLQAFAAIEARHYAYTMSVDGTEASGVVYAPGESSTQVTSGELEGTKFSTETAYVGGKAYTKLDFGSGNSSLGIDPGTWYELDLNIAKQLDYTFEQQSPVQSAFVKSISSVERDGDAAFKGTFDFAVASENNPNPQTKTLLQALGDTAKTAAFTAELDGQGNVSGLVFTIAKTDKTPEIKQTLTFTEFGTAKAPEAPANAQPAPASLNNIYK